MEEIFAKIQNYHFEDSPKSLFNLDRYLTIEQAQEITDIQWHFSHNQNDKLISESYSRIIPDYFKYMIVEVFRWSLNDTDESPFYESNFYIRLRDPITDFRYTFSQYDAVIFSNGAHFEIEEPSKEEDRFVRLLASYHEVVKENGNREPLLTRIRQLLDV